MKDDDQSLPLQQCKILICMPYSNARNWLQQFMSRMPKGSPFILLQFSTVTYLSRILFHTYNLQPSEVDELAVALTHLGAQGCGEGLASWLDGSVVAQPLLINHKSKLWQLPTLKDLSWCVLCREASLSTEHINIGHKGSHHWSWRVQGCSRATSSAPYTRRTLLVLMQLSKTLYYWYTRYTVGLLMLCDMHSW